MPTSSEVSGIAPTATVSQSPTLMPMKIAMPPTSGVGRSCQRSALGAATSRVASGERRSAQTASRTAGKAASAAAVLTCGEGRGAVLGLCLPARAVPRLVLRDDDLRRPAALPRAVREPLPARLPGEVQGVGARDRLVAPEPARAARRVPARLRAALPADDPALRDLPARGARVLDLLRHLAAGVVALARRLGGADQEGALPAAARRVLDDRHAGGDVRGHGRDPRRALARVHPRRALHGLARAAARARLRRPRRRARADRRVPERALPRHRAPDRSGAPAVVLPHADPLALRAATRGRAEPPHAAHPPLLAPPGRAAVLRGPRRALARASAARRRRRLSGGRRGRRARARRVRLHAGRRPDRCRTLSTIRPS